MADKKEGTDAGRASESEAQAVARKGGKLMLFGMVGGLMLAEGVAIFVATRFLGGPSVAVGSVEGASGETGEGAHGGSNGELATNGTQPSKSGAREILIAEVRAMSDRSGQNIVYDAKVCARVDASKGDKVQKVLEEKKATIEDRLTRVIRSADPQYFKEPGFETLRRQIKHELDGLIGEPGAVTEVLLPSLMWYNADG